MSTTKITIENETFDVSDELANEIRERARAESGEFVKDDEPFFLDSYGDVATRTFDNDDFDRAMVERGRVSRSREYLERYDAREVARERLRRAYLKVVGDWRWNGTSPYFIPLLDNDGMWTAATHYLLIPCDYKFSVNFQAMQFGTDNDADLRLVMEVD